MIVCSCNRVSDHHFRETIATSAAPIASAAQLYRAAGCRPDCGRCAETLRTLIAETPHGGCNCAVHAAAAQRDAA